MSQSSIMKRVWSATLLTLSLWAIGWGAPTVAQVDTQPEPLPIPEPLPPDDPLAEPTPDPTPPSDSSVPIAVTRIQVVGNSVLSAEAIAELVAPYANRTTTLAELQQLTAQLNQRYIEAGYITTQVRIPEQAVTNGVVVIEVLEGRLADITVSGSERYPDYVSSRIEQRGTDPLNAIAIEDQLQLLQLSGLFDTVDARLRQGERPGESLLDITIEEANPLSVRAFFDNYSPTSVGELRVGATAAYRGIALPGDALSAAISSTLSGGAQAYSLGYQFPLSPNDSALRLGFSYEDFNVTDETNPAFALGIRGDTRIYEAEYRYPIIRTSLEELGLSLGFRHRDGNSVILNTITVPSRTSVFQFSQDYLRRDGSGAWTALSQFSFGTCLFNATTNPDPQADGQFFSWLGQVQRVQVLSPDNLLIIRADLQLSADSLLGSEQFLIGGAQSVRGYDQNVRAGDNGLRLSVEDRIVMARRDDEAPFIQIAPFTDLGAVWFNDSSNQPTQQNFLWGVGAGVIVNPTEALEMRLDLGVPIITLSEVTDRNTGAQAYFSLGYRF